MQLSSPIVSGHLLLTVPILHLRGVSWPPVAGCAVCCACSLLACRAACVMLRRQHDPHGPRAPR
eukprot:6190892-Pleurochrysis_carterae.AAC.3